MTKRKSNSSKIASTEGARSVDGIENNDLPTQPMKVSRPPKAPRPSFEVVELCSDEHDGNAKPRHSGLLRDLNPSAVMVPKHPSVEPAGEDTGTVNTQHVTRQARHGKSQANYDMRFHPMDVVTRPKRAAKRGSLSTAPDLDASTDEESLPESNVDGDASDDSESKECSDEEGVAAPRMPDPNATRRSSRAATSKAVNYSKKHHPQDYALPGHQHKAQKLKRQQSRPRKILSSTSKPARKFNNLNNVYDDNVEIEEGENGDGENVTVHNKLTDDKQPNQEVPMQRGVKRLQPQKPSPRKKLRTLEDEREHKSSKKASLRTAVTETGSDVLHFLGDFVEHRASNKPTTVASTVSASPANDKMHWDADEVASAVVTILHATVAKSLSLLIEASGHKEDRVSADKTDEGKPAADLDTIEGLPSGDVDLPTSNRDEDMFMFVDDNSPLHLVNRNICGEMSDITNGVANAEDYEMGRAFKSAEKVDTVLLIHSPKANRYDVDHDFSTSSGEVGMTRRDSHQSQEPEPPSQFDEQLAVTELRSKQQADQHHSGVTSQSKNGISSLTKVHNNSEAIASRDLTFSANKARDYGIRDDLPQVNTVPSDASEHDTDQHDFVDSDNVLDARTRSDTIRDGDPEEGASPGNTLYQQRAFQDGTLQDTNHLGTLQAVERGISTFEVTGISSSMPFTDTNELMAVEKSTCTDANQCGGSVKSTPSPECAESTTASRQYNIPASRPRSKSAQILTPTSINQSNNGGRPRSMESATDNVLNAKISDDGLLRSFRSSQRARSDAMLESNPTTVDPDENDATGSPRSD